MSHTDLRKAVKDWYDTSPMRDSTDAGKRSINDPDINLDLVRLKVKPGSIEWTEDAGEGGSKGASNVVNVASAIRAGENLQPFGQIYASKEMENFLKVKITKGVIKGLNNTIELDLQNTGLSEAFGRFIEIDPSKPDNEIKRDKMRITVAVEKDIASFGDATADVTWSVKEYKGTFKCDIIVDGIVTIKGGPGATGQVKISDIIKSDILKMEGWVHFRWEQEQNMKLK